jgi:hypothetical protein
MTRKLKTLGLALVAVSAIAAVPAAASAAKLTAGAYPATLDGFSIKGEETRFKVAGRLFSCEKTGLAGLLTESSSTAFIERQYSECRMEFENKGFIATIVMNGCGFELHVAAELTPDIYEATVDIKCEGKVGFELLDYASEAAHAEGKPMCTYKVPEQFGLKTVELTNETEGEDIRVTPRVQSMKYEVKGIGCGVSAADGTYTGSTTVKATNEGGKVVSLQVK